MDSGLLTGALNELAQRCSLGYARLLPDALVLMRYLVAIEIVILGVFWALGKSDVTVTAIKKITAIGFFLWIVTGMQTLSYVLISSFAQAGLVAGGNTLSLANLFDPSAIIEMGFRITQPVFESLGNIYDLVHHPINAALIFIGALFGLVSYFIIAWNLFIIIIEFYLFTVCAVILVPFAVFKPTAWLAEKAIGGTFTIGVKLMVLAFLISMSYDIMSGLDLSKATDSNYQLYSAVSLMAVIAFLSISAPNFAASIISGGPSLSASQMAMGSAALMGLSRNSSENRTTEPPVSRVRDAVNLSSGSSAQGKTASGSSSQASTRQAVQSKR